SCSSFLAGLIWARAERLAACPGALFHAPSGGSRRGGDPVTEPERAHERIVMSRLPTGTITFLFTDVEGSTPLWEQQPDAMRQALAHHDACLRAGIEAQGGHVFKTIGDEFCAAFARAADALHAAI